MIHDRSRTGNRIAVILLAVLAAVFLVPVVLVLINSFKSRLYIATDPFSLPDSTTFVGVQNYLTGLTAAGFPAAFGRSLFITVAGVALIVLGASMTAWYLVRVRTRLTRVLYYLFVFSMVVPFQMVM